MARALLFALPLPLVATAARPHPDVWYGPASLLPGAHIRPDFFGNVSSIDASWPQLASDVTTFKIFLDMLYGPPGENGVPADMGSTDAELSALIAALKVHGIRTGVEVGGTAWSGKFCNLSQTLAYAAMEQRWVGRWLKLGGTIDSLTTDHANVKNSRPHPNGCVPAVPMANRIPIVAQVFASWRTFLGPQTSLGFIESLGYWDIEGPGGTNFTNTDPTNLNRVEGWIPRLEDVTAELLAQAEKHNPTPGTPLIDHYFIDFSLEGVEYDTRTYGSPPGGGVNYNRVLGSEEIMHRHGLKTGVFLNAFHDESIGNCSEFPALGPGSCSESAARRTINYTEGYMALPGRLSEHAVLEQWQPFPELTGPEQQPDTGMWMALQCADAVKKGRAAAGKTLADEHTRESPGAGP
jgi:hypothetical protein